MAICTRCHSSKPFWAPCCHACNEYASFTERLLGNLLVIVLTPLLFFFILWLLFVVLTLLA